MENYYIPGISLSVTHLGLTEEKPSVSDQNSNLNLT